MIKVYIFNKSNDISRVYDFKKFFQCMLTSTRHADSKALLETTILATVAGHGSYITLLSI